MPSIAHPFLDFIDKLVFPYRTRVAVPCVLSIHNRTIERFEKLKRHGTTKTQIVEALDEIERMKQAHEERAILIQELETIVERAEEIWFMDGR